MPKHLEINIHATTIQFFSFLILETSSLCNTRLERAQCRTLTLRRKKWGYYFTSLVLPSLLPSLLDSYPIKFVKNVATDQTLATHGLLV